jgi:hypothetical protein
MEQLSYNSTATSGLHCNHMLHAIDHSVFATPSPFGCNKVTNSVTEVLLLYLFSEEKIIFFKT